MVVVMVVTRSYSRESDKLCMHDKKDEITQAPLLII